MKILIAYYSKSGSTEAIAKKLSAILQQNRHMVTVFKIRPMRELKAYDYGKNSHIELKQPLPDVSAYDLILIGTPVWSFCPSPIVSSYLRQLRRIKGKRVALFASCMALPGTTIQRMSSILSTKGAVVAESLTIRSVFKIDETKLGEAEKFVQLLLSKQ